MVLASGATDVIIALLTGSALSAVLTYLGLRLTKSGRARTTDADNLWVQEARIREHLERDNQRLRGEFESMTGQVFELRTQVVDIGANLTRATIDVGRVRGHLRECRADIRRLEAENERLRRQLRGGS